MIFRWMRVSIFYPHGIPSTNSLVVNDNAMAMYF